MSFIQSQRRSLDEEEEDMLQIMLLGGTLVPHAIKTAKELDLFEIIAKAKPSGTYLTPSDLASMVAPRNPDAPMMIDRLLRFLVAYSVCCCKLVKDEEEGRVSRAYGLGKLGKKLIKDEDGLSIASFVLFESLIAKGVTWSYLTQSILEGGAAPIERARGKCSTFEYMKEENNFNKIFNESMSSHTSIIMKKILENYDGFASMRDSHVVVDVGGGLGTNLSQVLSKFPHLNGINFDLPHVICNAPPIHGVEHIGGDMFNEIPQGQVFLMKVKFAEFLRFGCTKCVEHIGGDMFNEIPQGQVFLMKWILHDWSDEKCVEILKNCKKALPQTGKLIIIEMLIPREITDTDFATKASLYHDLAMMCVNPGGKERSKEEFEVLAIKAGFKPPKIIYGAYSYWILEFYPN